MTAELTVQALRGDEPIEQWPFTRPCGCNLDTGYCAKHGQMIERIHKEVWAKNNPGLLRLVWLETDAYGERGMLPAQGHDWSGVRDSSPYAIERMIAILDAAELLRRY